MPFSYILHFFPNKILYKATIYSSYNEYRQCYYNVKNKDSNFRGGLLTIEEHEQLNPEAKKALTQNTKKQQDIVKEMVGLVKVYCKKYPDEDICKFCNFKTYDEYPYRLEQTIPEWMTHL
jgi:hypothetical protein